MKGYEIYFQRCQHPDYLPHYIDYGLHKEKLRHFYQRRRQLNKLLRKKQQKEQQDNADVVGGGGGGGYVLYGGGGGVGSGSGRISVEEFAKLTDTSEAELSTASSATAAASGSYFRYDEADPSSKSNTTSTSTQYMDAEDALLRLSIMERKEFSTLLETHLSASATFYTSTLLPRTSALIASSNFDDAASHLLETLAFAITNIITFRQLLIRYDAFCRTFGNGMSLSEWHLQRSVLDVDHCVHGFLRLEGVEECEKRIVMGMQTLKEQQVEMEMEKERDEEMDGVLIEKEDVVEADSSEVVAAAEGGAKEGKGTSGDASKQAEEEGAATTAASFNAEEFSAQIQNFVYLLDKTDSSLEKAVAGHVVFKDRMLVLGMRLRQYLFFGFQSRGLRDTQSISLRGRHFKKEIKVIGKWRATHSFSHFSITDDEQLSFKHKLREVSPENVFPLFLNLVSCFLFMMNNYIIEPSSAYYAEALGSSDALSGLMIGAAPWFALTSSVAYSYWTNYNYKQPIVFAGILQFVGNLMYANAYAYGSVELCLIGRAITGLGAPRIINRRYVADATPFSLRTAASAAFAMATALGAALGPGMAIVLDRMNEFEFHLPFLKEQYFNGMTGPGYFMALSWFIYTVVVIITFGEPTRSGLDELRKREESGSSPGTVLLGDEEGGSKKTSLLDEVELAAMSQDEAAAARESAMEDAELDRQDSMSLEDDGFNDNGSVGPGSLSHDGDDNDDDGDDVIDSSKNGKGYSYYYCSCIKNMTRPVIICMSLIFMKRIALESIVGSTSIITKNRYGWNIEKVGTLHLVNGIIVIPVSIFSGYLSTMYEDRYMSIWFLAITLFGMGFLFDPTDLINHEDTYTFNEGQPLAVGPVRYIAGSLIAFSGIEACESYVASLMSKVVPSALAQGTFNSGLLATLVGTGGRATGDLFITLMGLISIRNLLNLLIIPGAALVAFSISLIMYNYELLAV